MKALMILFALTASAAICFVVNIFYIVAFDDLFQRKKYLVAMIFSVFFFGLCAWLFEDIATLI